MKKNITNLVLPVKIFTDFNKVEGSEDFVTVNSRMTSAMVTIWSTPFFEQICLKDDSYDETGEYIDNYIGVGPIIKTARILN